MLIDARLGAETLAEVPAVARAAERLGFSALWTSETRHDPLLPLALAAVETRRIGLGTSIALAFPRSPMSLAYAAWDLQAASGGRFLLGLGTQVKAHIERRFSVPWGAPGPRLREVILALRAIWDSWQNGTRLKFEGTFYRFSLMTPFFNPGPIPHYPIPIYIAAVNPYMCRLAGELCDGLHVHPFHTTKYVREVVLPAVAEGLARSGRSRGQIALATSTFVAAGAGPDEIARALQPIRQQIAFYASTPTYRVVMECHGWGEVADRLHRRSVAGDWDGMAAEITDEMVGAFVVTGNPDEVARGLRAKYRDQVDRLSLYLAFRPGERDAHWRALLAALETDR